MDWPPTTPKDLPARSRVLITSINYPPEHTGIGPYVGHIAEHLAATGHHVEVITGVPHYPSWLVAPEFRYRLRTRETRNGVDLRRLRHYVPRRQSALRRGAYEGTFLLNGVLTRARVRPDVVLVVSPSLAAAALGQSIARRAHVPNAVFVQDLMGAAAAQSGISGGSRVARATELLEGRVLRAADAIGVVHASFTPRIVGLGVDPARIHVVPNWSHIRSASQPREAIRLRFGWRPEDFIVLHAGNMGLKQGLDVIVGAARAAVADEPNLRFVLLGDGNQKAFLKASATGLSNLTFEDSVDDDDFPDVLAAADALAVTQRGSVLDMSLPSKLTSYFAAAQPVLASVAVEGGTANEVRRAGAGVVVPPEDASALLAAIRVLRDDPAGAATMGRAGRAYAESELSMSAGLSRVSRLLGAAMNRN
ncbi:MAG: WcaI family glycosyltransferase [Pseudonocardiales bacterium]